MDNDTTTAVTDSINLVDATPKELEEEHEFDEDFFDDEKSRKPKGKKVKKMRFNFDR